MPKLGNYAVQSGTLATEFATNMTRADHLTRFKSVHPQLLADRPISVKLPVDIDAAVRALPEPSEWLRRVICEAMKKEVSSDPKKPR